jgi:hypothetical protein
MLVWARFLTKFSSIPAARRSRRSDHASVTEFELGERSVRLPFRQIYFAGEVHAVTQGFRRLLMVGGKRPEIAGSGMREFDELVDMGVTELVCQTMPGSPEFRLLMAVRPPGANRVRAVAIHAQSAAAVTLLICLAWFSVLLPRQSAAWAALCLLLLLASLLYLLLAFQAVRSLRRLRHDARAD